MSITFYNDVESNWQQTLSPCFCADRTCQYMAHDGNEAAEEAWELCGKLTLGSLSEDEVLVASQKLKPFADSSCSYCKGQGVYSHKKWSLPPEVYINWSNGNGYPILRLLGVAEDDLYSGEMSISEARRALLKALNSSVDQAERPEEKVYGKPRQNEDGTWELKPVRMFSPGMNESDIKDRLYRLMDFVKYSARQGASKIYWS